MHFRAKGSFQAFRYGIDPLPEWAEEAKGKRLLIGGDTLESGERVNGTPEQFVLTNPGQIGARWGKKGDFICLGSDGDITHLDPARFQTRFEPAPRCEHCKHFSLDRLSTTHGSCHSYGLAQYNAKTGEFTPMQVTSDFGCVCFERKN